MKIEEYWPEFGDSDDVDVEGSGVKIEENWPEFGDSDDVDVAGSGSNQEVRNVKEVYNRFPAPSKESRGYRPSKFLSPLETWGGSVHQELSLEQDALLIVRLL